MERKKVKVQKVEETPLWKKVGQGSLRIGNRIIKPGQVFEAFAPSIPEAFADVIVPANDSAKKAVSPIIDAAVYTLEEVDGGWNILDSTGKVVNEEPLDKEAAENLIIELEK